jgi:hypothetical protein
MNGEEMLFVNMVQATVTLAYNSVEPDLVATSHMEGMAWHAWEWNGRGLHISLL